MGKVFLTAFELILFQSGPSQVALASILDWGRIQLVVVRLWNLVGHIASVPPRHRLDHDNDPGRFSSRYWISRLSFDGFSSVVLYFGYL